MNERKPVHTALLSVSDKRGLVDFARSLVASGIRLVSTGGTARTLVEAGLDVTPVTDLTGFPECFDGRVKTLHPAVHGGILAVRENPEHQASGKALGIEPIDLVVVNLYPFRQTIARPDCTWDDAVENIDIGGPAMVRAAAKNHEDVAVVVDPANYAEVAEAVTQGGTTRQQRRNLALTAFRHTAAYDSAICAWMEGALAGEETHPMPSTLTTPAARKASLRYGENPHQHAALYGEEGAGLFEGAEVLQGKELSYNNIIDLDAAVEAVGEFDECAAVVIKHTNPCGVGRHDHDLVAAWEAALEADPVSAFGGIVALNREVDAALAGHLQKLFLEVVAAPAFTEEALSILAGRKNLRLVTTDPSTGSHPLRLRSTRFGLLAQQADPRVSSSSEQWQCVTERSPTNEENQALAFLWRVCKHVKSNAIVIGSAHRTFGVGAGQMSRVDSVELAIRKATGPLKGSCLASDAFFPFRDGLDAAARAGVRAIVQPGGSRRDDEVIAAANEHGLAMVVTGTRHFRH